MRKQILLVVRIITMLFLVACSTNDGVDSSSDKSTIKYAYWNKKQEAMLNK